MVWKEFQNADKSSPLDPTIFTPFTLVSKEGISPISTIFTVSHRLVPGQKDVSIEAFTKGSWSVQVKQPNLMIARSYTPLPPFVTNESQESWPYSLRLSLYIRNDPQGELSRYLHSLEPGAPVEVRGPYEEYNIGESVDEILFLAGGTGIAPALQLAHTLFQTRKRSRLPRMHILWANRRLEDCSGADFQSNDETDGWLSKTWNFFSPVQQLDRAKSAQQSTAIVKELKALEVKHEGHFSVDYFADEGHRFITHNILQDRLRQINDSTHQTSDSGGYPHRKVLVISGPDGFISHFSGPKSVAGGQGALGGVLQQFDLSGWTVWKL
ncbi:MAG: hypothetical protein Q9190_007901 [Brigantiaea leucoxantha]